MRTENIGTTAKNANAYSQEVSVSDYSNINERVSQYKEEVEGKSYPDRHSLLIYLPIHCRECHNAMAGHPRKVDRFA